MTPKTKMIVRNILISPVLIVRVPVVVLSIVISKMATVLDEVASILPGMERLPLTEEEQAAQRKAVMDKYFVLTDRR